MSDVSTGSKVLRQWPWIMAVVVAFFAGFGVAAAIVGGDDDGDDVTAQPQRTEATDEATENADGTSETGEASAGTPEPTPSESTPADDASESQTPETSERGHIIKDVGELSGLTASPSDTIDDSWLKFTITDLQVTDECSAQYAEPPANGHYLVISMDISTAAASEWPNDMQQEAYFIEHDFSVIGPDGVTQNDVAGNAYSCLDESERLPNAIGPGEKVTGELAVDVASETGVLAFQPSFTYNIGGWEWEF